MLGIVVIVRLSFCFVLVAANLSLAEDMPDAPAAAEPAQAAEPAVVEPAAGNPAAPPAPVAEPQPDAHPFGLPSAPELWLNFAPLSLDRLQGKGLVLYFFDDQSDTCAGKWPSLLETSAEYASAPVLFIGINSGTSPQRLAAYVAQHQIVWPILADVDRSFERAALGNTIDRDNPYQIRIRAGDGRWEDGLRVQMPAAVKAACEGAVYRVLPARVPRTLRPAWGLIELGDYASAAPLLTRAARDEDQEIQTALAALQDVVDRDMQAAVAKVEQHLAAGDQWQAYGAMTSFLATYSEYDYPETYDELYRDLGRSEAVQNQQAASARLKQTIRIGSAGTPAAVRRGTTMLEQLVAKYPDTEAAAQAQSMLDRLAQLEAAGDEPAIEIEWRSAGFRPFRSN